MSPASLPSGGTPAGGPVWSQRNTDPVVVNNLAEALCLPVPVAQVLVARGLDDPVTAYQFLHPDLDQLHDPYMLYGIHLAVQRVKKALAEGEKILIYGDYDVDGVCAVALLLEGLTDLGANVTSYIPRRLVEGYGLHKEPLLAARQDGVSLVITVDTGAAAVEVAQYAGAIGLDLIITDHHQLQNPLPPALALLHPRHPQGEYPFPHLCGAGVAYKLLQALMASLGCEQASIDGKFLQLVALATIADVVPLYGENRVLVTYGLEHLRQNPRPGLSALCRVAGIDLTSADERDVAFGICPRLNAAGRMGDADLALQLLLSKSAISADQLATILEAENYQRQKIQERMINDVRARVMAEPQQVVVLSDPTWHPGVAGIVAARLAEDLSCPVLLAAERDGVAVGSARSVAGFNIVSALEQCADLLMAYGGHEQAAGFELPVENIPLLQSRLNLLFQQFLKERPPVEIYYDAVLSMDDVTSDLVQQLQRLAPFGAGNPEPCFLLPSVPVRQAQVVGRERNHLKLYLSDELEAIGFGLGDRLGMISVPCRVDLLAFPTMNDWQGCSRLQLKFFALHHRGREERRQSLWQRDVLAALYRNLRAAGWEQVVGFETVVSRLAATSGLTRPAVERALTIFQELGLIHLIDDKVQIRQAVKRVDLYSSPTYRWLVEQKISLR